MPSYLLHSGETIEYPLPTQSEAAFLNRLFAAATDPTVTPQQFLALLYGEDNPILDRTRIPGRGMVTQAVFDNPIWRVMSDLIDTKHQQLGLLDPAKVEATYSISVPEAAKQLGITQSSVRSAIAARKLSAHLRNGQWYTRAESLASYKVSNRGRKRASQQHGGEPGTPGSPVPRANPVRVRVGSDPGVSLSVRVEDGELIREGADCVFSPGWRKAVVRTTATTVKGKAIRAFEIEPAESVEAIRIGDLFVEGPFRIMRKINNPKQANELWRAAR